MAEDQLGVYGGGGGGVEDLMEDTEVTELHQVVGRLLQVDHLKADARQSLWPPLANTEAEVRPTSHGFCFTRMHSLESQAGLEYKLESIMLWNGCWANVDSVLSVPNIQLMWHHTELSVEIILSLHYCNK